MNTHRNLLRKHKPFLSSSCSHQWAWHAPGSPDDWRWGVGKCLCSGGQWPCHPTCSAVEGVGLRVAGHWVGKRAHWRGWSAEQGLWCRAACWGEHLGAEYHLAQSHSLWSCVKTKKDEFRICILLSLCVSLYVDRLFLPVHLRLYMKQNMAGLFAAVTWFE